MGARHRIDGSFRLDNLGGTRAFGVASETFGG